MQRSLGPRREKARRTRGECAQASGCLGRLPRREKAYLHLGRVRPSLWLPKPLAAEGKGAPHPGRGRPSLWLPQPLMLGKAQKRRRNRIRTFVEYLKTGTALNARPAPYRAAGSLSNVDGESTDTPVRGKPSVAGTRRVLPTHSDVCLQRPALPAAGLN